MDPKWPTNCPIDLSQFPGSLTHLGASREDSKTKSFDKRFWATLCYESSTLILYNEVSSTIFQRKSVSQLGTSDICPNLHFVEYRGI